MTWGSFSLLFAGSAAAAWLGGFLVYWVLAKCHIVDVPNARSSHNKVVIRGGGLTILLVLAVYWMLGALNVAHFELLNPWIIGAGDFVGGGIVHGRHRFTSLLGSSPDPRNCRNLRHRWNLEVDRGRYLSRT